MCWPLTPPIPSSPPTARSSRAAEELKQPDTTLIDERTRRSYGRREAGAVAELARRVVRVIGTFKLGTDFANDGNAVMTDRNFVRFFPDRRSGGASLRRVDLGLVKLAKGADAEAVAATIRRDMGTDLDVFTRQQLREREMRFWQSRTPIGTIFTIGLVMGFVVGVVICYQILATDVRNNLPEYATLKAMGYGNSALVRVVTGQALWLSCLGFLPGLALSIVFYAVLEAWDGSTAPAGDRPGEPRTGGLCLGRDRADVSGLQSICHPQGVSRRSGGAVQMIESLAASKVTRTTDDDVTVRVSGLNHDFGEGGGEDPRPEGNRPRT